ncbi:glycoside hydrolase [Lujinxingia sediminis]|uniref:Glycoside hydrolase n=1 Tax=Lujinxingia sediminis TaxID=2480984 RepID=A0ABY0CTN2_9DELT|nr:glycoside hydrolase family 57 protein [Lujinxingia sediminis]RVU44905.1 glycoside hydrolase [Lujinxingia sediminis]
MSTPSLDVLFIWHMHQPYYGVGDQGDFELPWVRLHAVKAYFDMAWLLAENPQMHATFNFSGSLLLQLQEWVEEGRRDAWWHLSRASLDELSAGDRRTLVHHFFSLNHPHGVRSLPRYAELLDAREARGEEVCAREWGEAEFGDLQMLFNLAWCGFAALEEYPRLRAWRDQGRDFSREDRLALLDLHIEIMARVLPLYRELWERGQIEVSVTPMFHPIMPLLIDTDTARRATPQRPTPPRLQAPDDARRHIAQALEYAEAIFGRRPSGMWPSEGSVSPEAVALFEGAGVRWIASDEAILAGSCDFERDRDLWRSWRLNQAPQTAIFFRDHGLSDRLGFSYAHMDADEAAADLIGALEGIARAAHRDENPRPMAAIILDGENPWEHYPEDGRLFLQALYERLGDHASLVPSTPGDHLARGGSSGHLEHLHSGSWILGNYQIWIGHSETNLAWELLGEATRWLDEQPPPDAEDSRAHQSFQTAHQALMMAQGSDWFWWYGDDFSSEQDALFDSIFRALLRRVYTSPGHEPPGRLHHPINDSKTPPDVAAHRVPTHPISPRIDGRRGGFFDWEGAGSYLPRSGYGAMFETTRYVDQILYGCDHDRLYVRVDPGPDLREHLHLELRLTSHTGTSTIALHPNPSGQPRALSPDAPTALVDWAFAQCWELALSRAALDCLATPAVDLRLAVLDGTRELRHLPVEHPLTIELTASPDDWFV